jgi:hypothetical protein
MSPRANTSSSPAVKSSWASLSRGPRHRGGRRNGRVDTRGNARLTAIFMNFIPAVASVRPKCSTSRGLRWSRSSLPVIPHSLITTTPLGGDEKFNQTVASAPLEAGLRQSRHVGR